MWAQLQTINYLGHILNHIEALSAHYNYNLEWANLLINPMTMWARATHQLITKAAHLSACSNYNI